MALRRKFNSKAYYFDSYFRQKGRATAQAESLRRAGNLARVVRNVSDSTWEVWVGRK